MAMAQSLSKLLPAINSADYTLAELRIVTTATDQLCTWLPTVFHYTTLNYAAHVTDMNSIQLNVTTNTNAATVTVDGTLHDQNTLATVVLGTTLTAQLITVVVTSPGSQSRTYTVNVYRLDQTICILAPTNTPTASPSRAPTAGPTFQPSWAPSSSPSFAPSHGPTFWPTSIPTATPTFRHGYNP